MKPDKGKQGCSPLRPNPGKLTETKTAVEGVKLEILKVILLCHGWVSPTRHKPKRSWENIILIENASIKLSCRQLFVEFNLLMIDVEDSGCCSMWSRVLSSHEKQVSDQHPPWPLHQLLLPGSYDDFSWWWSTSYKMQHTSSSPNCFWWCCFITALVSLRHLVLPSTV